MKALWHHKIRGVGVWYPVWQGIRSGGYEPEPPGPWFVPPYQSVYEQLRADIEAERSRRLSEEEERGRLADIAERQRQEERQRELDVRQARVRGTAERREANGGDCRRSRSNRSGSALNRRSGTAKNATAPSNANRKPSALRRRNGAHRSGWRDRRNPCPGNSPPRRSDAAWSRLRG